MGCWNKTCGLSNLPIYAGEEVYTFILEKSPYFDFGDHCSSTHLYTPILIPFHSEYDDYGTGENNHGIGLQVILNSLKEKLIEKEVGENTYHDIAVKKDKFDEGLLFDSMREGRLVIKNFCASITNGPPENKVDFLMMKKNVVDNILTNYKVERCTYIRETGDLIYNYESFGDVVQEIDRFVELVKAEIDKNEEIIKFLDYKDNNESAITEMKMRWSLLGDRYFRVLCETNNLKLEKWMWFVDSTMGSSSRIVSVSNAVNTLILENKLDEAKEFMRDFLKGCFIAYFMERTRRSWIPQCGEGSQDTDLDPHKLLAQTILEIAKKDEAMFDEDEDEEQ